MQLVGQLKSRCCCDAAEMSLPWPVIDWSKSGVAGVAGFVYYAIGLDGVPLMCIARLLLDELQK